MNKTLASFLGGVALGGTAVSGAWLIHSPSVQRETSQARPPSQVAAAPAFDKSLPNDARDSSRAAIQGPMPTPQSEFIGDVEIPPAPHTRANAESVAPSAQGQADAHGRSGNAAQETRMRPPRWEEMTEEQREEMKQRFQRFHDERVERTVDHFVRSNNLPDGSADVVFDVIDDLNDRILSRIESCNDLLAISGERSIRHETATRIAVAVFSDMLDSYEQLSEKLGPEWKSNPDGDIDLGQLVDPELMMSLFRLGNPGGGGGRGGPPRMGNGPGGDRRPPENR